MDGVSEMDTESSRNSSRAIGKAVAGGREIAMPVITAVAVVIAALSVVASVLDSRIGEMNDEIDDLRGDVEQIKRDVGDLREDVAYIKGRIDEALKRPE